MDPVLLAGVDHTDNKDTSFAGVLDEDTLTEFYPKFKNLSGLVPM